MFSKTLASDQEHLVISQYDAYQDGALTEAETTLYRQHLDTCSECRIWAENQVNIARQLANEAPAPAILSPAAAARIQQNVSSKMRRALIMNNVRTVTGGAVAFAVLALVVGIFVWQSRTLNTIDFVEQVVPEIDTDGQATPEIVAASAVTDEQLIEAVNAKDAAEVEKLLKAGANADAFDSTGDPILKAAIMQGNTEIARLLVENGADVNATDKDGNALLGKAAYMGDLEIVQLMLDAGADANAMMKTGSGSDPGINVPVLQEAVNGNNSEIVELLIALWRRCEPGRNAPRSERLFMEQPGTTIPISYRSFLIMGRIPISQVPMKRERRRYFSRSAMARSRPLKRCWMVEPRSISKRSEIGHH